MSTLSRDDQTFVKKLVSFFNRLIFAPAFLLVRLGTFGPGWFDFRRAWAGVAGRAGAGRGGRLERDFIGPAVAIAAAKLADGSREFRISFRGQKCGSRRYPVS